MKRYQQLLCMAVLLAAAGTARANHGGSADLPLLHGYVLDAITKKPVSGVVVSVTLPGTNGAKEVTTDADGYFHFSQLPSSQVNLQFEKKGYQHYKKASVTVKEKASVKINIEFLPEDAQTNADEGPEYPMLRLLQLN